MVEVKKISVTGQVIENYPLFPSATEIQPNAVYQQFYPFVNYSELVYEGKSAWWIPTVSNEGRYAGTLNDTIAQLMLPRVSRETDYEYSQRIRRSRWQPFYKSTIDGIAGLLTKTTLKPDTLKWLDEDKKTEVLNNIDRQGSSLSQFLLKCDKYALRDGFCAVSVQRPVKTASISKDELKTYLTVYERNCIIDWEHDKDCQLIRVVLEEKDKIVEITPDVYNIYDEDKLVETIINELGYIPIVFYSVNTFDPFSLMPPLYAIADNNVHHYQVYSDYRESLHFLANPIVVREGMITGMDDAHSAPPLVLGARQFQDIPTGGKIYVVSVPSEGVTHNQAAAQEIKADILEQVFGFMGSQSTMTATEAGLRAINTQANLRIYATQKESATEEIFKIWADYDGKENQSGQGLLINKSIFNSLTPELIREYKDLLINQYLDLESFWLILGEMGGLPEDMNPLDIVKKLVNQTRINGEMR